MQDAPTVYDIELAERREVIGVECRAALHAPLRVVAIESVAQLARAGDRRGVVVERHDVGAESAGGEAEQTAAGSDVEEATPLERLGTNQLLHRAHCGRDPIGVEMPQEVRPVL